MKKVIIAAIAAVACAGAANAERQSLAPLAPCDNWSVTIKGGVASPLDPSAGSIIDNIRGGFGVEARKQIAPAFGLGIEGDFGFNTSTWNNQPSIHTAFDAMYVGAFGAVNLNNLFAGYAGQPRICEVEIVAGAGWIHTFGHKNEADANDDFGVKTGLNLNFNLGSQKAWTIGLKPAIVWNVSNQTYKCYSTQTATAELAVGLTYHFACSNGTHSFAFAAPCDYTSYQDQINDLRATVEAQKAANADLANAKAAAERANADLKAQLDECRNRPVVTETVVETNNTLESIRYVYYGIGSSKISSDQRPNVEMIAQYMKNNPESTIEIKGYASKDGNIEYNKKLAAARAQSVKDMLVNKYGIKADRIKAEGQGIGEMFKEEGWNRVAICILND